MNARDPGGALQVRCLFEVVVREDRLHLFFVVGPLRVAPGIQAGEEFIRLAL